MAIMRALELGYTAEFGFWDRAAWYEIMDTFRDANLYQTWSYDWIRYGRRNIAHMVLRKDGSVVAAAQSRVMRVPGMQTGIAYTRWGPMWRRTELKDDKETFRQAVRALRNELSRRRGLVVRLYPLAFRGQDDELTAVLEDEGYSLHETGTSDRTLIMDVGPPVEELRAALEQKWRNKLNQAERKGLEVVLGEGEELFDAVASMYAEMALRKRLDRSNDIEHLRMVQKDLPEKLRLKVILCRLSGEPCAGAIFAAIGTTGLYVRGATSDAGLKTSGSYVVQWAFVRWLREHGFLHYDLNGANADLNPGTDHFKRGLAGKRGRDLEFLGRFQVADNRLSEFVVRTVERVRDRYHGVVGART
jgi:lipid II:glycine glycyltransferase (peptidoglycan interpeptide bridge formation enzyme)